MIKHILNHRRLNPETPWFVVSEEFNLFRETNFISTGKIISRDDGVSADQIFRVVTTMFLDLDSYTEFITATETVTMVQQRNAYNKENSIYTRSEMQII